MSGYCKWCDTVTNAIVKVYDGKTLLWSGCPKCYENKKKELENVTVKE